MHVNINYLLYANSFKNSSRFFKTIIIIFQTIPSRFIGANKIFESRRYAPICSGERRVVIIVTPALASFFCSASPMGAPKMAILGKEKKFKGVWGREVRSGECGDGGGRERKIETEKDRKIETEG